MKEALYKTRAVKQLAIIGRCYLCPLKSALWSFIALAAHLMTAKSQRKVRRTDSNHAFAPKQRSSETGSPALYMRVRFVL